MRDILVFNTIKHERHSHEVKNVPHDSYRVPLHRTRLYAITKFQVRSFRPTIRHVEQQRQAENKYSQVFASNHIVTFLDLVEKVGKEIALVETNIEAVGKEIQDVTES